MDCTKKNRLISSWVEHGTIKGLLCRRIVMIKNKGSIRMSVPESIAIIISIIAIIFSSIIYWNDTLKSFELAVFDVGRVELIINQFKAPNKEPALIRI